MLLELTMNIKGFIKICQLQLSCLFQAPCHVGDTVTEIETPALVVCLKRLEENLHQMTVAMSNYPNVTFRPHVKAHKCPVIARMQVSDSLSNS